MMKLRLALVLLFVASVAYATDPFIERLADSAEELKKGEYAKALTRDERIIQDLIDVLGPGDVATKWFSVAVAHKALALAGLGREDDAIWYWHMALNLYPAIEKSDMSMFGAPAELLKKHPLAPPGPDVPQLPYPMPANFHAPVVKKRVEPQFPRGAQAFGVGGAVIVECVIDKDGTLRDFLLLKTPPVPTLSYAAMEAMRQWKFQPATIDGQPKDVIFHLTINFKP